MIHRVRARDQTEAIIDAIAELEREPPGDVLVFLSGEREIRDTADALNAVAALKNTEVLPLYARLPTAEQQRVFEPHRGRRVVLATNVAETSLTVPGIRYVVDPGTARISRYSRRTKVQRLPIEAISQASAAQRAGRCGRVADGVCIRLYSERDFAAAAALHRPGDPAHQPRRRHPADGRTSARRASRTSRSSTHRIAAACATACCCCASSTRSTSEDAITETGRRLAQLPVDPRVGRMILQAATEGCVREVLVLAAALSIPDPRERPTGPRGGGPTEARTVRRRAFRFRVVPQPVALPARAATRRAPATRSGGCAARSSCTTCGSASGRTSPASCAVSRSDLGITESDEPADPDRVHAALLAGLAQPRRPARGREPRIRRCAQLPVRARAGVGTHQAAAPVDRRRGPGRDESAVRTGRGTRRTRGGRATRRPPRPAHATASRTGMPQRGAAMAYERVTLYGLPLIARRRIGYASVEPGRSAGTVHPARARRGGMADPPPLLPRQPGPTHRAGRARGSGPAPRSARRPTTRSSRSTTHGYRPMPCPRATSTPGGRRRGTRLPTC